MTTYVHYVVVPYSTINKPWVIIIWAHWGRSKSSCSSSDAISEEPREQHNSKLFGDDAIYRSSNSYRESSTLANSVVLPSAFKRGSRSSRVCTRRNVKNVQFIKAANNLHCWLQYEFIKNLLHVAVVRLLVIIRQQRQCWWWWSFARTKVSLIVLMSVVT